jgi:hypothetical protein
MGTSNGRLRGAAAIIALTLTAVGCSKGTPAADGSPSGAPLGPRPSSTAEVKILSPTNGQTIHGGTLQIRVQLTGGHIVQLTSKNIRPDQGHLHIYLDNQIVGMNFATTDTVGGIKPGQHILRVEFVASDHLPFDPRVFTATTFKDVS